MAADKINGKSGNKDQQHGIDDQCGGPWIKTDDQREPCDKLQEGHKNGNQVDEKGREKVIPVNNLCKNGRRQNLVITGIYKGHTKNPTCRQLDPVVTKEVSEGLIQLDTLPFPSPDSRR